MEDKDSESDVKMCILTFVGKGIFIMSITGNVAEYADIQIAAFLFHFFA